MEHLESIVPRAMAEIIARWAGRREEWGRFAAQVDGAKVAADVLEDLAALLNAERETLLSLDDAAKHCGYSADHLGRLIRSGKLANLGRKHSPLVRLGDLPRKANALRPTPLGRNVRTTERRQIARALVHSQGGDDAA